MPLSQGKSAAAFSKNVATEMHHDKPLKQSLAIAYAMKRKAQHKAMGGACYAHGKEVCPMCHGGQMAEGGFVGEEKSSGYLPMPEEHEKHDEMTMHEDTRMLNQHGEHEIAAEGMEEDNEPQRESMYEHPVENQDDHEDMVGRIMKHRSQHYSKGGQVANDTPPEADFEDNDFDDLVKRGDLSFSYTGANSGDEIGNDQEDEDKRDMVSKIMKSRRLKAGRLPNPA